MMGIYLLVAIVLGMVLVIFGLSISINNPTQILETLMSPTVLTTAGLLGLALVIGLVYLNVLLQIAMLKIVYEGKEHTSVIQTIKDSRPFVWPVFLISLITGLITFGGFMLLVIPGIIFSLLLSFAQYEIVFNGKRGIEALRRSFALFATDFWGILGRMLVFILLSFLLMAITTSITGREAAPVLTWIVSTCLGWFGIAYNLTIHKELHRAHPGLPGKNISGIVITSLVGYLLFALFLTAGINLLLHYKDSLFAPALNQYENQNQITPPNMQEMNSDENSTQKIIDNEGYPSEVGEYD